MTNSINTNYGAIVALQGLNRVNESLNTVQNRVSTGLKVANAFDDGASFAVAQSLRGDIGGLSSVNERLSVGRGITSTAVSAGTSISNTLKDIKSVSIKLADQGLSATERTQYKSQFDALVTDVSTFIRDASFNGKNLLNGDSANLIGNLQGDSVNIGSQNLSGSAFFGALNTLTSVSSVASTQQAAFATFISSSAASAFSGIESALGTALNSIAADDRRVNNLLKFNADLSDAITRGLGSIVDADLARESANLQSLQVRQQLSAQTLGIANQAPQILLGLFR